MAMVKQSRVQDFFKACEAGNIQEAEVYLDIFPVDICDDSKHSALHVSCANGHESIVRLLLKKGASCDIRNAFGWTPLMQACRYGHANVVALLLQNRADPSCKSHLGASALLLASWGGHLSIVRILIEFGIDVNDGCSGFCDQSSLIAASMCGHDNIMKLLIGRGADVNYQSSFSGISALSASSLNGHMTSAQLLVEHGADPNLTDSSCSTALDVAVYCQMKEVIAYLERKTVRRPTKDAENEKCDILEATKAGNVQRVREVLMEDRSQVNACQPEDGATPLMFASMLGNLEIVDLLVKHQADLDRQDTISGWTALMQATFHGKKLVVKYLIAAGAEATIRAFNGCTAFDLASLIDDSDAELVRLLASLSMQVSSANRNHQGRREAWVKRTVDFGRPTSNAQLGMSAMEDASGIKAWWAKMSTRLKNLRVPRSINRLTPADDSALMQTAPISDIKRSASCFDVSLSETLVGQQRSSSIFTLGMATPLSRISSTAGKSACPPFAPPSVLESRNLKPLKMPPGKKIAQNANTTTLFGRSGLQPNKLLRSSTSPSNSSHLSTNSRIPGGKSASEYVPRESDTGAPLSREGLHQRRDARSESSRKSNTVSSKSSTRTLTPENSPPIGRNKIHHHEVAQASLPESLLEEPGGDSTVAEILKKLSLENYSSIFEEEEVDIEAFITLNDQDLNDLGISQTGPRNDILKAIAAYTES